MKIASVIGATGYVGSAIVKCLLSKGYQVRCTSRVPSASEWLKELSDDGSVELFPLELSSGDDSLIPNQETIHQIKEICRGSTSMYFCAGFEKQEQATINFMVSNALATIEAARSESVPVVVLTSSGGSTNPIGLTDETPKSETLHWSNPEAQLEAKKFSPAAKTLMEINSLKAVGRNQQNEIIDESLSSQSPRLVIMNPNLILGPQLQPGVPKGNSLPWVKRILTKEAMSEKIPNDSMSIIDVRDLAELHVAAAEHVNASGRYFGVNQSYKWEEILNTFSTVYKSYTPPPRFEGDAKIPTQFDHSRKNSLGVTLRPLEETLRDLITFMKERNVIE